MKSLKEQLLNEGKGVNIQLSDKEAEWLLGCLLDGYEAAEKNNSWKNGSIMNKKEAVTFFGKIFDEMSKSCDFIEAHNWYREIEKNIAE